MGEKGGAIGPWMTANNGGGGLGLIGLEYQQAWQNGNPRGNRKNREKRQLQLHVLLRLHITLH